MIITTGYLTDLIRNPCYIIRSHLVCKRAEAKLTVLALTTDEKPSNIIHKRRMRSSSGHATQVWSEILIKVDKLRREVDRYLAATLGATLAPVI